MTDPNSTEESRVAALEAALNRLRADLVSQKDHNARLIGTLRDAREQIVDLKGELDRVGAPPAGFATFLDATDSITADVLSSGRKMQVPVGPGIDVSKLVAGQEVMLNDSMTIIGVRDFEDVGEIVQLKELIDQGTRALIVGRSDEERVIRIAQPLQHVKLKAGDSLLLDTRSGYATQKVAKSEVEELILEEVPDIQYEDIGGLGEQIESIRDAVELPFLYPDLYTEHHLMPPKGILLYGPPGCGKTLIAKAVANSLAKKIAERNGVDEWRSFFLNIKGPVLLN